MFIVGLVVGLHTVLMRQRVYCRAGPWVTSSYTVLMRQRVYCRAGPWVTYCVNAAACLL